MAALLQQLVSETLASELAFTHPAGSTKQYGRLAEWLQREALPNLGTICDVPEESLDSSCELKGGGG